jgi:hypothetical protein
VLEFVCEKVSYLSGSSLSEWLAFCMADEFPCCIRTLRLVLKGAAMPGSISAQLSTTRFGIVRMTSGPSRLAI